MDPPQVVCGYGRWTALDAIIQRGDLAGLRVWLDSGGKSRKKIPVQATRLWHTPRTEACRGRSSFYLNAGRTLAFRQRSWRP